MAEERIDIIVDDKVNSNVQKKIEGIATSADKGFSSVERLKAALASINTTSLSKLQAATASNENALARELAAQAKLTEARSKSSLMDARAAVEMQKLATETARTEAAELRLAAAKDRGAAASLKAAAASETEAAAQARIAAMVERSMLANAARTAPAVTSGSLAPAGGMAETVAAAGLASGAIHEVETASAELAATTPGYFSRFKEAALSGFDSVRDFITGGGTRFRSEAKAMASGLGEVAAEAAKATPHIKGNSTAIRELLVIAREGGRGDFNRMAGSVSILAGALGLLKIAIPLAIAAAIGFGAAKIQLNTETEKKSLTAYAESLGLTEKEMKRLSNTTVDASGKLKEHNVLQITAADILNGTISAIKDGISSIAQEWGLTTAQGIAATRTAISFMTQFFAYLTGGVYAFAKFLYNEVYNLFAAAQNVGTLAGQAIYVMFAAVANGVVLLLNAPIYAINALSAALGKGDIVKPIGYINSGLGAIGSNMKALKREDFFGDMKRGAEGTLGALKSVGDHIKGAARDRIKAEADAMKANRTTPKGRNPKESDPKTQSDYINDTNLKLDNELQRMGLLKDAREEQSRLDQIEEEFAKRRQPLDAAQLKVFADKIHAIQIMKYEQSAMDRIVEEAQGPQRDYNASLAAATKLLNDHVISQQQFSQQQTLANRKLAEANDPLLALKDGLDKSERSLGLYGDALAMNNQLEEINAALKAKGIVLGVNSTAAIDAEVAAMLRRGDALRQNQFVQNQVAGIVAPLAEEQNMINGKVAMYAEIDRLRKQDLLNEQGAARAKYALDAKFSQMRLAGAQSFFGDLASLSSSGNKKIAAIGKAAAVAQATIDGYLAVQKALSAFPPPWNIAAAAAVAIKTGAQVAGILSTNVGSFATGGSFVVGGDPGVDKNNINMNVTRGERVTVETPAQQRAGGKSSGEVSVPVKIINITDPKQMLDHLASEEGGKIIFNHLSQNPNQVRNIVKGSS